MKKRVMIILFSIVSLFFFGIKPVFCKDGTVYIIKNAELKDKTRIFLVVDEIADCPYPNKEDSINKLLGRRVAVMYAYKKMEYLILRDIYKKVIDNYERIMRKEGYMPGAAFLRSDIYDGQIKVTLGISFDLSREEFRRFRSNSEKNYRIQYIKSISEKFGTKIAVISKGEWMFIVKGYNPMHVDKKKTAELDNAIKKLKEV